MSNCARNRNRRFADCNFIKTRILSLGCFALIVHPYVYGGIMTFEEIDLTDLLVNRANDRHGELMDEDAAIEWLLTHRSTHMRNLTRDLVASGEVYEPPLVRKEGKHYVVYDGNRRATALKLLNSPQKAPSQDWAKFFANSRKDWMGNFPKSLYCQIEQDLERLDEILYRRHTGQKNGVGQSQWDAPAKTNFERRTGKNDKIDFAEEIEKILRSRGKLIASEKIPRSNMKRLFSAEQFRNRAGISVQKNKLKFTHTEEKVLTALERIAKDLIAKDITLEDLWDSKSKKGYLDKLDKEGILPGIHDLLSEQTDPPKPTPGSPEPPAPPPSPPSPPPEKRKTLIRNIDFGFEQTHENRRILDIFFELQHSLKFENHDNAIAIAFRVLLELSLEHYIALKKVVAVNKGDNLNKKYTKVLAHMLDAGTIGKKYHDALKKFEKSEPIFSTTTLHSYVHSSEFFPSDHHLKSMWDTLEKFIVRCIKH